ncbi:MAG: hypothetical protein Lokiarch_43530 [Candidatus Lokiarchaeum sp. GC14_75]|nr:MAG: hypothetical protein Lokiarch_43530 [Candidatus Lokiarchaeum sp. GC14_75]
MEYIQIKTLLFVLKIKPTELFFNEKLKLNIENL